jgi:hypothetical protein
VALLKHLRLLSPLIYETCKYFNLFQLSYATSDIIFGGQCLVEVGKCKGVTWISHSLRMHHHFSAANFIWTTSGLFQGKSVRSNIYFSQFYLYINRSPGLRSFVHWPIPKHLFIRSMTEQGAIRLFVHWLFQVQSVYLSVDWSRHNLFICSLTDPGTIRLFEGWPIQVQSAYLFIDWSRCNPFIC